ncbi:cytochrome-c peroxidase [Derxia lacustris]|uniref:cytochrome-c peroxidase n=1 Tax=Derxia lacustris TaxID=764842 RepID=UPI000A17146D|nr:cytochrome c peroxidase [Derxia lacustris]
MHSGRAVRRLAAALLLAWMALAAAQAALPVTGDAAAARPGAVDGRAQSAPARIGSTPERAAIVSPVREFHPDPALAALGRRLFFDASLSRPAGSSCASCHDPAHAWGGGRLTPAGVSAGSRPGHASPRATPSLLYVRQVPPLYFYRDDDALAPSPFGGLMADGRADTLAQQAALPLLNPDEMNNRNGRDVAARLARADYAGEIAARFGRRALSDGKAALDAAGAALEAFLQSEEMAPYSSRFDDWLRGRGQLAPLELRGMALFRDPDKGNCASCHQFSPTSSNPARSPFTDFGYDAIAAPRNRALAANRAGGQFDLGLCRTARARGWPEPDAWCGWFRTPTLRNVAERERFMHNGALRDLREVLRFYATRATAPDDWYPPGARFDDLPPQLRGNVNVNSVPYNRRPGAAPAFDEADIDALLAFLRTLSDRPAGAAGVR